MSVCVCSCVHMCSHAHLPMGSGKERATLNCVFSPVKRKRSLVGGGLTPLQRKPQRELLSPALYNKQCQAEVVGPNLPLIDYTKKKKRERDYTKGY